MRVTTRYKKIMRTFGKRLRKARAQAGFRSAQTFAEHLGIEPHTYRHWERGESAPNLKTLVRLCAELSITPNDLLPEAAGTWRTGSGVPPALGA